MTNYHVTSIRLAGPHTDPRGKVWPRLGRRTLECSQHVRAASPEAAIAATLARVAPDTAWQPIGGRVEAV